MRILVRVSHADVGQLDVEVLVHAVQRATDGQVVLQFNNHVLSNQKYWKWALMLVNEYNDASVAEELKNVMCENGENEIIGRLFYINPDFAEKIIRSL